MHFASENPCCLDKVGLASRENTLLLDSIVYLHLSRVRKHIYQGAIIINAFLHISSFLERFGALQSLLTSISGMN